MKSIARTLVALAFVPCASVAGRLAVEAEPVLAKSEAKVLSLPTKLAVASGTNGAGASAVALSFDVAVVGAPQDAARGAVHVYVRQPGGAFGFAQRLLAPDGANGDNSQFGTAVSLEGDRLVVGAPGNNSARGAAYVFRHAGAGSFAFEQKLVAGDGVATDEFGISVASAGDTIAVGARLGNFGAINGGAVYVYTRPAATFVVQQKITPETGGGFLSQNTAGFGSAIALLTDHLYVGAPFYNGGQGMLFKYVRSGSTWSYNANRDGGPQPNQFGTSVAATSGFQVYVGAPNGQSLVSPGTITGFVFAYDDSTGGMFFVSHVENAAEADTRFGAALDAEDGTLMVGAPAFDATGVDQGEVHRFDVAGVGSEPVLRERLVAADAGSSDKFGAALAFFGGSFLVGAPGDDDGAPNSGSVYAYDSPVEETNLVDPDGGPDDLFGNAVAIAGNVKLVGTPHSGGAGAVEIYFRDVTAWTKSDNDIRLDDPQSESFFGASVAMSDDTNVVVIGAPKYDVGAQTDDRGRAFVFVRQGDAWVPGDVLVASDAEPGDNFGASVAISPDGTRIVVGAPNKGTQDLGRIYVFETAQAGAGAIAAKGSGFAPSGARSGNIGDKFGASVAIDDAGTIAVGVPLRGNDDRGAVEVLRDTGSGFAVETLANPGGAANDNFGSAVSLRNGELVAGIPNADRPGQGANDDAGAAMMFDVGTSTSAARGFVQPADARIGDKFGSSVGISDGIAIVGAPLRDVEAAGGIMRPNAGSARMLLRQAGAWLVDAEIVASDRADEDNFGAAVAIRARTLTAGAPLNDDESNNFTDQGASYVFRIGAREPVLYGNGFE